VTATTHCDKLAPQTQLSRWL